MSHSSALLNERHFTSCASAGHEFNVAELSNLYRSQGAINDS